jgi:hypothetical protein
MEEHPTDAVMVKAEKNGKKGKLMERKKNINQMMPEN